MEQQQPKAVTRQRWREWLTISALCLTLGFAYAVSARTRQLLRGEPVGWGTLVTGELLHFATWVLLYPGVAFLAARFPLGERRARSLLVHLAAALVFSPLLMSLTLLLRAALADASRLRKPHLLTDVIVPEYAWGMTAYVVLLSVASALEWRQRDQRRALEGARLEVALTQARLQALQRQIQPHFLFNALNSISALLRKDPDGAERMLARLGDLLRVVLDEGLPQQVTLREELRILVSYLAIERVRFCDRLSVSIDVPETLLDRRVPCLVLQPLVENSIRHGLGEHAGPLHLALCAQREERVLRLVVEDDGGRGKDASASGGIGLANVRSRLEQLHGTRARLEMTPAPERGVRVLVELPWDDTALAEGTP